MAKVIPGRFTAQNDEPFVVFLIGMRINHLFAFKRWIPTALAMRSMLILLYRHPGIGMLGSQLFFYRRGIGVIQYWRSFEALEQFARSKEDPHLAAWRRFNRAIGTDGSVGIWHETYLVEAGQQEGVYNNMPLFGFAAATQHVPAVGRNETARRRLGGESEPAVPTPPNPVSSS
ncbi:transcriptional regulator [Ktedonobacteria bacterium brp13]|nr:transcriptional regulator [Ktedonobacteria bacterium brp13]